MTNHNGQNDTNLKKQNEWEKQLILARKIVEIGAQNFFSELRSLDQAFMNKKSRFVCMDEGTAHHCCHSANFGLAGSGVLYPGAWPERVKKMSDLILAVGINEITSHDGCGAAGIAFKQTPEAFLKKNQINTTDDFAFYWAAELTKAMHKKYPGLVHHKHINAGAMARPHEFHNAVCVWFNYTETFDPSRLGDKVPNGFLNEPGLLKKHDGVTGEKYALKELSLAIRIAFGDHGFGKDYFNQNNPFLIIIVENQSEKVKQRILEVSNFLKQDKALIELLEKPLDYLHIDGFSKP